MATDSTHVPQADNSVSSDHQDINPEVVQLAQTDGTPSPQPAGNQAPGAAANVIPAAPGGQVDVVFPEGQNIVRVQVGPGEIVNLPFDSDLAAKFGQEGNLAIKVGDRTIILLGYAEANQQEGVTLKTDKGEDVDVATVIASTDPNLDIQTAAGGTAGAAGTPGSGFFDPFHNGGGLGGFGELDVINQTELQYQTIQPDANRLIIGQQENDTAPDILSILPFDVVINEDDLVVGGRNTEGQGKLGGGNADYNGNDEFDGNDNDEVDHGVPDGYREPLTITAAINVDFKGDVPGTLKLTTVGLDALHLTSDGSPLHYTISPDGLTLTATRESDGATIFTAHVVEASSNGLFHVEITLENRLDHPDHGQNDNDPTTIAVEDYLNIPLHIVVSDSDGSTAQGNINIKFEDDVPVIAGTQDGEGGPGSFPHTPEGTPLNMASPTGFELPAGVTPVGGIVLEIIGLNGARVVTQLPASALYQGYYSGNPGDIGTQGGFTPELLAQLGGGIKELAVRVTLYDGDTAAGNFDAHANTLLLNGHNIGDWTDVNAIATDGSGNPSGQGESGGGFRDETLDTGWFHVTGDTPAGQTLLNDIYNSLSGGSVKFQVDDPNTPGDNYYDFKQGLDGGLVDVGLPPVVQGGIPAISESGLGDGSESVAGSFQFHYGADGPANGNPGDEVVASPLTLGLKIVDPDAPGGVYYDSNGAAAHALTSGGQVVVIVETGMTGTYGAVTYAGYIGGIQDAAHLVFQVSVDKITGDWTATFFKPLDHPDAGVNGAETGANDQFQFILTATITDDDGDQATGSQSFLYRDDGPSLDVSTDGDTVTIDETPHRQSGTDDHHNGSNPFGNKYGSAIEWGTSDSSVVSVSVNFGADGAAATGSLKYALQPSADGVPSGLKDTATGNDILLYQDGNNVVGKVGGANGPVAFVATIDQDGKLTVAEYRAIQHDDKTNPNDSESLTDGALQVKVTATDRDGDSVTQTVDIGSKVTFKDDGPSLTLEACREGDRVVIDETPNRQSGTDDHNGGTDPFAGKYGAPLEWGSSSSSVIPVTVNFGTDGPAASDSIKYALQLPSDGVLSGLKDTATGNDIRLYQDGDNIVGKVGGANGTVVLAISIDQNGKVTVAEYQAIQHPDKHNPNDSDALNDSALQVKVTVTDGDGDSVSKTANIGNQVVFKDDGPSLTVTNSKTGVTIDESANAQSGTDDHTSGSNPFGNKYGTALEWGTSSGSVVTPTAVFGTDGPAAGGGLSYALQIPSSGVLSGLQDTATGSDIRLYQDGNNIVGKVGNSNGAVAFVITIDQDGKLTVAEYRAIQHPDKTNPNDSDSLDNGALQVKVTATDGDGDSVSKTVNVGSQVTFKDDGPSLTVTNKGDSITIDETDGRQSGTDDHHNGSNPFGNKYGSAIEWGTSDSSVVTVTAAFGTDGPASGGGLSYALQPSSNGVPSGLKDTATGNDILLYQDGNNVVGKVGGANGPVAFVATIDQSGKLTVAEYRAIQHDDKTNPNDSDSLDNGALQVKVTATDRDGDSVTQTVDVGSKVTFKDDGPSLTLEACREGDRVVIDESPNRQTGTDDHNGGTDPFAGKYGSPLEWGSSSSAVVPVTVDFGTDGPAANGAVKFALQLSASGVLSGLKDTATGSNILLYQDGNNIVGKVGGAGGAVAFAISIDQNGKVTVAEYRAIQHQDKTDANDSASLNDSALQVKVTVTDGDGDSVSKTANIGNQVVFKDDGPSAGGNATVLIDDDALSNGNPGGIGDDANAVNTTGTLSHTYGTDGAGSTLLTGATLPNSQGFTQAVSDGGKTLTISQYGVAVVKIVLTDAASGSYTVTQLAPVKHPDGQNENNVEFTINYKVTDGDGDSVPGSIKINVDDDTPTAHNDEDNVLQKVDNQWVADGNVISGAGTLDPVGGKDTVGADGAKVTKVDGTTISNNGTDITHAYGTLHIAPDGTYTYTVNPNATIPSGAKDVFTYTLTDADGDTSQATLTIDFPTVGIPTTNVALSSPAGDGFLKEDVQGDLTLTAMPGEANDTITEIKLSNIPANLTVDAVSSHITLSNGTVGNVTLVGGVLTIEINGATAGSPVVATVHVTPQEDSDVDGNGLVLTAKAEDGPVSAVSAPNSFDVVVDAVLDQYLDVTGASQTGTESNSAQAITLGLHAVLADAGFPHSGAGGADTDGSEVRTLSLVVALPAGGSLSVDPLIGTVTQVGNTTTYTLTAAAGHTLDEVAAAVQVTVPANYVGTITGQIVSTSEETTHGVETDTNDNSKGDTADFSVTIGAHVSAPTVAAAIDGDGYFKEDVYNNAHFTATPMEPTDHITQIVVSGLTGWSGFISVNVGTIGSYNYDPVTSVLTVNVDGATDGTPVVLTLQMLPPEDTDVDSPISVTATAADHGQTATSAAATTTLVVDAVLDQYLDVTGASQTGTESNSAQAITLGLHAVLADAGFAHSGAGGADTDGSEVRTLSLVVALPVGGSLSVDPLIGTVTQVGNSTTYTLTAAAGHTLDEVAAAVQVTVPANYVGSITGQIVSTSDETTHGTEFDTSDNSKGDTADFSVTIGAHVSPPTVGVEVLGSGYFKEDVQNSVKFTATPTEPTDHITQIQVTGLAGWSANTGTITLSNGTVGSVSFSAGVLTINVTGSSNGTAVVATVQLTPPADSDNDASIGVTATAADGVLTASNSTSSSLVVDAVLDEYLDVSGAAKTGTESNSTQTINLGLHASLAGAGFPASGQGGSDTDGSEVRSVTLVLGSALPAGATLTVAGGASVGTITVVDGTHFTLTPAVGKTFEDVAAAVQVTLPANYTGSITGQIVSTSEETTHGVENDTSDNSKGDTADFSVTIGAHVLPPTVGVEVLGSGYFNEDVQNSVKFTATPTEPTDHVTQIQVTGLTGWSADTGTITLSNGTVGSVSFSGGVLTINVAGSTNGTAVVATVKLTPPEDSDVDASIVVKATAADGALTATSAGTSGTLVVDANADQGSGPGTHTGGVDDGDAAGLNVSLTIADSNDAGSTFQTGETGKATIVVTFDDYKDGSETHQVILDAPAGFNILTASLPALPAGVTIDASSTSTHLVLNVATNNSAGSAGFTLDVPVQFNGSGTGSATFNVTATAKETNTGDLEPDTSGTAASPGDNFAKVTNTAVANFDAVKPINYNDAVSVNEPGASKTNVMIILDRSQSMVTDDPDGPGGYANRLALAKAAIQDLINKYDQIGDVSVMVVQFATGANNMSFWGTPQQAMDYINAAANNPSGQYTNYQAAVEQAATALNVTSGKIDGGNTVVYFMSDGQPTAGGATAGESIGGNHSLTSAQKAAWDTALENSDVSQIYSVAMGSGIPDGNNNVHMNAVANPDGDNVPASQVITVTTETQLSAQLQATVGTPVNGNVLDGSITNEVGHVGQADVNGSGTTHIQYFKYTDPAGTKTITFQWDGDPTHAVTVTGGASGQVLSNTAQTVTFTTVYGTMTFYFKTGNGHNAGDFTFVPTSSVDANKQETFHYYTQDSNNQTETATPDTNPGGADLVITINNLPDNVAPVNNVPGTQTVTEDTAKAITGLSVTDPDAGTGAMTVTLSVQHGTVTVDLTGSGATADNNGTGTVVLHGTLAQINAALSGNHVSYLPSGNYNGSDTLTMTTNDNGNTGMGGAKSDADTVTITIDAVNDAPVNNVPGAQAADAGVQKSIAGLSITDVDAGTGSMTVTLSVAHGSLNVTGSGVSGNNSGTVTITGTLSAINTILGTVKYTAASGYSGSDTLTITTNDNGNTGSGGAKTDVDTVAINVTIPNTAPTAGTDHIYTNISTAFSVSDALLMANDTDAQTPADIAITAAAAASGQSSFFTTIQHVTDHVNIDLNTGSGSNKIGDGETATFNYTLSDGHGLSSTGSTVVHYTTSTSITGGATDDIVIGGSTDDTLDGAGGINHLFGGDGNDRLYFNNVSGSTYDGGNHTGSADFSGASNTVVGDILDLTHLANNASVDLHAAISHGDITNIETIDLGTATSGSSARSLTVSLNAADVISVGSGTFDPSGGSLGGLNSADAVKILGGNGDVVNLQANTPGGHWTNITNSITNEPSGFKVYAYDSDGGATPDAAHTTAYVIVSSSVLVHDENNTTIS